MKLWTVQIVYYYGVEKPEHVLESDLKLFADERHAIDELNRVIRDDWTTEVQVGGETRRLADCRGMSERSCVDESEWYYSKDGRKAWAFFSDAHGYKGEVIEKEVAMDEKQKVETVARELEDMVNNYGCRDDLERLSDRMTSMHRTLVQSFTGCFIVPFVRRMAKMKRDGRFDARDAAAVEACELMERALVQKYGLKDDEQLSFPLI